MLINSYSKSVYNIALNFFAERDIASDVTQEIFIKIYHNLRQIPGRKEFQFLGFHDFAELLH